MHTYLVQSGVLGYEALLDLVHTRHSTYCLRYGFSYLPFRDRSQLSKSTGRPGNWDGVDRIVEVLDLADDGDIVVHLDADSIIQDLATPLDSALLSLPPTVEIAMVPSTHLQWLASVKPYLAPELAPWMKLPQFISGGCYMRATSRIRHLWRTVAEQGPLDNPMDWKVQARLMRTLADQFLAPCPLHPKWFQQPYHTNPSPVVFQPLQGGDSVTKYGVMKRLLGLG